MARARFSASTGSAKVVESYELPACLAVLRRLWMSLQAAYDLKELEQNKKVMERVARDRLAQRGEWRTKW